KAEQCGTNEIDIGPSTCPQLNIPNVKPMITAINMTRSMTSGYDKTEYGGGWSEPTSAAKKCGWPPGKKGYIRDCRCCYVHTHVHDLNEIFADREIEIEYMPGMNKGCTTTMTVYSSTEGEEWTEILEKEVTQKTWSPKTTYKETIKISDKFRYIKIYIPKCYNDYSSAWVIGTPKPTEDTEVLPPTPPEEKPRETRCCCTKKTSDETITLKIHRGWNLFSIPGELSETKTLEDCDTRNWKVFEYIKDEKAFRSVKYPEIGKAYWVYATTECSVNGKITTPTLLDEIEELTPKWNLVPVVPDMMHKTINELGDCNTKTYTYDATAHKWKKVSTITPALYGKGLAIRTENTCTLGEENQIPIIPPFPDDEEMM
ncbi:discoidin domain-containing protein, partial [archaeon]|nr:discoidin domain-containing protein [archaeon]